MEIKDRLLKIIASEGITSAAFADAIGVQRSSISHIVSGRNKPGLDFLQKILNSFPKYNAEWLVMGIGDIYKPPTQSNLFGGNSDADKEELQPDIVADDSSEGTNALIEGVHTELNKKTDVINEEDRPSYGNVVSQNSVNKRLDVKKIEKIVIFYDNKTFSEYYPELE